MICHVDVDMQICKCPGLPFDKIWDVWQFNYCCKENASSLLTFVKFWRDRCRLKLSKYAR